MRNAVVVCFVLVLFSCSGKLSEEDRKALKEEMENREIRQIRDEDILTKALAMGREMRNSDSLFAMASLNVYNHRPANDLTAEIWEAYQAALDAGMALEDNIQRDYPDNLIYSYAWMAPDSVLTMTVILIPKTEVVKSLY